MFRIIVKKEKRSYKSSLLSSHCSKSPHAATVPRTIPGTSFPQGRPTAGESHHRRASEDGQVKKSSPQRSFVLTAGPPESEHLAPGDGTFGSLPPQDSDLIEAPDWRTLRVVSSFGLSSADFADFDFRSFRTSEEFNGRTLICVP